MKHKRREEIEKIIYEKMGYAPKDAIPNIVSSKHNFWISLATDQLLALQDKHVQEKVEEVIKKFIIFYTRLEGDMKMMKIKNKLKALLNNQTNKEE